MPVGKERPTYDRESAGALLLDKMRRGMKFTSACRDIGIGRATPWRWAKEDPAGFGLALVKAHSESQIQRLSATPPDLDCAYAAGVFDGEGNVSIMKGGISVAGQRFYNLSVSISNTKPALCEWFQHQWRGMGTVYAKRRSNDRALPLHVWMLSGPAAEKFLRDVMPWLIIKRSQAELALKYRTLSEIGQTQVSEEHHRELVECYLAMRRLNARGATPREIHE